MSGAGDAPRSRHEAAKVVIRVTGAVIAGVVAAYLAWPALGIVGKSDFNQLWYAARSLLAGGSPYGAVGPGRSFDWPFPLFYPLPGVLAAVPFTLLTPVAASILFSGISAALLAWAFTRDASYRLLALLSFSFYYAVAISQWSPLLITAALIPSLGFVFAVKPTIGLALWLYRPRWEAVAGCLAIILLSFAVRPQWLGEWVGTFGAGTHIRGPITMLGGPLILLALLRWRRPEARLLVALACVPHTTLLYEALPLFLIPASWVQALLLLALNWAAEITVITLGPYDSLIERARMNGVVSVALLYIPCLIMILRRPNEGEVPAWIDRGAARISLALSHYPLTRRALDTANALMHHGSGKISLRRPRSGAS
ncbi:MAG TPA: hypothetical protein VFT57_00045 [Gemmatimonadaceae bacterium]|nr:hypothetical protein [Gemmatimonadaceae bacterium]